MKADSGVSSRAAAGGQVKDFIFYILSLIIVELQLVRLINCKSNKGSNHFENCLTRFPSSKRCPVFINVPNYPDVLSELLTNGCSSPGFALRPDSLDGDRRPDSGLCLRASCQSLGFILEGPIDTLTGDKSSAGLCNRARTVQMFTA